MGHRITRATSHLWVDEVKERMKTERRACVRQHWGIIYHGLVAPGKAEQIALHTGVSATTVHRLISRYNRVGPAAIEQSEKGGRHHEDLTVEQEQAFLQPFFAQAERGEIATVEQIHQAFEAQVQHRVHINSIYPLLHRHGWRKLAPRSRHPKANQEEQDAFPKKNFQQAAQAALATRDPPDERPVLLMAQDEGCFGRLSIPRGAWAPPGVRPHAPRQVVRDYTYVYAAVAHAEGKMTSLILPSADTQMMNLFLSHVSSSYAKSFVVMQVDQAGWHMTEDLTIPENIRLIPQPADSPELNPGEHVWEELREKQLSNLAFASLDDVIDKVCEGLNQREAAPERLRSLTYFPHFRMVS